MTNSKNIILIVVVVLLFVAAAFVLFTGGAPGQKAVLNSGQSNGSLPTPILPHGSQLDFSQLDKYNPDKKLFDYPTVTPDNVGVNLPDVLKPNAQSQ